MICSTREVPSGSIKEFIPPLKNIAMHRTAKKQDNKFLTGKYIPPPHHNRFTALFPGPPGWAGARRELLDFMVQREINRGRHTDHPAGRHSIRTNQCPPPLSPHFLQTGCPSCQPTSSVKALKMWVKYIPQNEILGTGRCVVWALLSDISELHLNHYRCTVWARLHDTTACQTGWTTGWMFVFNRLWNRFFNRFDNRLYRVNVVS